MKVLCIFHHRPEKVKSLLPYTGVDYRFMAEDHSIPLIPMPALPSTFTLRDVRKSIKTFFGVLKYKPDVIISHGSNFGIFSWFMAKLTRAKFVSRLGGDPWAESGPQLEMWKHIGRKHWLRSWIHFKFLYWQLKHADKVIIVSPLLAKNGIQHKSYVIPTTCNISKFDAQKPIKEYKIISVITNTNYRKKMEAVYQIAPILNKVAGDNVLVNIVAYGKLHDEFIKGFNVQNQHINIRDWEDDMPTLYRMSDLVIYWSEFDICPNVVLETWASKTPLIVNKCNWSEQMIPPDTAVFSDLKHLETDIKCILDGNNTVMVNKGYRFVNQHHSEHVAGNKLKMLLQEVTA